MAIIGTGVDIISIDRIINAINKNKRFINKILGEQEYTLWQNKHNDNSGNAFIAKRFAAKEAFSKALGIGFIAPITWHNLQIIPRQSGQPQCIFNGELLNFMLFHQLSCHISLSDEKKYAVAQVIIEKN